MTLPGAARDHAAERRRRAEEIAREQTARSPEGFAAPPSEDPRRTLHELRVHQIELELQNEELRWAQGELEQLVAARTEELRRANEELRADIAERRRAEAALRLSERRYRDVVENLHEGLWLIDSQNRTTFANPYLAKMLGYTPEDMLGQSLFAFLDEAAAAMCQEHLDRCRLNLRETHDLEFRCRDGRRIHTRVTAAPILDEQGRYAGAVAAVRDITQRLALEREVLQISEREQRRIGEDLHDGLGQELTAIELLCSSLKIDLPADRPELREQMERMGGLLRNAIRQTRTLAHGLTGFRMTSRSLSAALAELAQSVSSRGRVRCHFEGASVSLDDAATAGHLYRIAQEAVHNALKHAQASQVTILLSEQAGALLLVVSDNGRGFPHPEPQNPGMGLQVMQHRANVIGARLKVESKPSQGVTVTCKWRRNRAETSGYAGANQP